MALLYESLFYGRGLDLSAQAKDRAVWKQDRMIDVHVYLDAKHIAKYIAKTALDRTVHIQVRLPA